MQLILFFIYLTIQKYDTTFNLAIVKKVRLSSIFWDKKRKKITQNIDYQIIIQ
jgi:hypothetical protein